jgi:hypothetical protein
MTRCSACLTAIWSRSDSQGHSGYAGALQIAQFGAESITSISKFALVHYCGFLCGPSAGEVEEHGDWKIESSLQLDAFTGSVEATAAVSLAKAVTRYMIHDAVDRVDEQERG